MQEQNAEEIARRKAAEKEQIKEVTASGGITEEQAVETATGYLQQVFGLDGSGMELNHYYNESAVEPVIDANTYCVNWSDYGNYRYYYFHIDALDGTLRSLSYSHDIQEAEAVRPTVSEASGKIANIKRQAQDFLEEKLKIRELISRLDGTVTEVILATNPTPEGETTAMYLSRLIAPSVCG